MSRARKIEECARALVASWDDPSPTWPFVEALAAALAIPSAAPDATTACPDGVEGCPGDCVPTWPAPPVAAYVCPFCGTSWQIRHEAGSSIGYCPKCLPDEEAKRVAALSPTTCSCACINHPSGGCGCSCARHPGATP